MSNKLSKNQQRALAHKKIQKILDQRLNTTTGMSHQSFTIFKAKGFALSSLLVLAIFILSGVYIFPGLNQYQDHGSDEEINRTSIWLKNHQRPQTVSKIKINIDEQLHKDVTKIVKNTPMEAMVNEIAQGDRAVAAYLVGIAMKESKFGKFSPKKEGVECYNYWGYRGKENTTKSGYSCFSSPKQAISVVGGKIASMLKYGSRTPAQMISWKCGSTCAGHNPESVRKWIADVEINYYKLNPGRIVAKNK